MSYNLKKICITAFFSSLLSAFSAFADDYPTIPDANFVVPEKRDFQLNNSISPCHNFFNYTCSKEIEKFKLPESKSRYVFSFNDSAERIKKLRLKYINYILNKPNLNSRNKMIKNFYLSCSNENSRKNEEFSLINNYKNEIMNLNREKLLEKFALESLSGNPNLISIDEDENIHNPKIKDIQFSYSLPLKVKDYYNNQQMLSDYNELIKNFFDMINMNNSDSKSNFIVQFEKDIASVYPSKAEMRELSTKDNSIQRKYLLFIYPQLNFKTMLDRIPNDVNINVITKDAFSKMNTKLQNASLSELQALALWNRFSKGDIKYSYPDFYSEFKNFKSKYNGLSKAEEPLDMQCTQETVNALERNLDIEVVNTYYNTFPSQRVKNIVNQVQKTTLNNIQKNTWLSQEAKHKAELKIQKIRFQLVKPEHIDDWDLKDEIVLNEDTFIKNKRSIAENDFKKMLNEIEYPVNDLKWQMSPLTVNAYYNPTANQFVMPLGILQPPFFDETKSDIVNYGSVGMVVAHEIGHSIDDQGSKYDETGKLNPWMNDSDLNTFKQKTQKIITVFARDGIDGKLTLGENIADFVGLQNAFQSAFPNNTMNIEKQKEFFIQYAKTWCGVIQPKNREFLIKTDPHSPIDLRVNDQMKLSKKFEETFSCSQGDSMTLPDSERITLW